MKHDKSNKDLDKGMDMPGSTSSQGSQSGSQGNPSRGNLEESEVGASSRGSQSGTSGSSRTDSSSSSSNQGTSGNARSGTSDNR